MCRVHERVIYQVPMRERADTIASLDGDEGRDVEAAWAAEIVRRAAAARGGRSEAADRDEVRRRIERDVLVR